MDANASELISYPSVMPVTRINGMKTVLMPVDCTGVMGEDRYHDAMAGSGVRLPCQALSAGTVLLPSY